MNIGFVSMYDCKYFAQVMTACISILKNFPHAKIFLFSLDGSYIEELWLRKFGVIGAITVIDVKSSNLQKKILKMEKTRNRVEVIFSLKPYFLNSVLNYAPNLEYIAYFDADLFFFNNKLEKLVDSKPELIVFKHQFSKKNEKYNVSGKYNAGLVVFKNSTSGRKLIDHWASLCYEECNVELKGRNHADQGYLEILAEEEKNTLIVSDIQFNQSTWSIPVFFNKLTRFLNPSIYHYHGFRIYEGYFITNLNRYGYRFQNLLVYANIYRIYIKQLSKILEAIGSSPIKNNRFPANLRDLKQILTLEKIYRC